MNRTLFLILLMIVPTAYAVDEYSKGVFVSEVMPDEPYGSYRIFILLNDDKEMYFFRGLNVEHNPCEMFSRFFNNAILYSKYKYIRDGEKIEFVRSFGPIIENAPIFSGYIKEKEMSLVERISGQPEKIINFKFHECKASVKRRDEKKKE